MFKRMPHPKRWLTWYLLGLVFVCSPKLFATEHEAVLRTQHFLEERILKIVRGYDKNALVFVDLSSSSKNLDLPALPFVFDINKLKSKGEAIADLASVTIFSSNSTLPDEAQTIIRNVIKPYTKALNVKVAPFPEGYEALIPVDVAPDKAIEVSRWSEMWEALQTSSLMGGITTAKTKLLWWGLIGAITLFCVVCFFVFGLWRHLGKIDSMQGVIELGLGKVASALENHEETSASRSSQADSRSQATPTPNTRQNEGEEFDSLSTFPDESLLALLSDCYWSKEDEYAAFLWRRVPIAARKRLIDTAAYLGTYASHLAHLSGENKGFENDPYYLAPLDVNHLSNEALSKLVNTHDNLYRALPELRSKGLDLPLKDRLALEEQRASNSSSQVKAIQDLNDKLKQITPSALRPLRKVKSLPIRSVSDEQELLSWEMPSIEIMSATPSLVWAVHLPDDVLTGIVTNMPAKELAGAMVAPESVLRKIASLLQPKRREAVGNYMNKVTPQRENKAFRRLHQDIVDALKAQAVASELNLTAVEEDSHDLSA